MLSVLLILGIYRSDQLLQFLRILLADLRSKLCIWSICLS